MSEDDFLTSHGWANAAKTPLAGDASGRKYTRLTRASDQAVLMDEGPGSSVQLNRFANIARHLASLGLSAPKILADGSDQFLLIEDLGDAVFSHVLEQKPALAIPLYEAAIDALIVSQSAPVPNYISNYGPAEMTEATLLAFEWYPTPDKHYSDVETSNALTVLKDLLTTHLTGPKVLIQRDFHAENLIWLPKRFGPARAGLLDFQDAVSGHPAYDLASLLVDARRDVAPELRQHIINYFVKKTGFDPITFQIAFALCSAQRNLRILGIFSRLAIRDGKPRYIDLIPRVWQNMMHDLEHPILSGLQQALAILPKPTTDLLDKVRAAHVS